MRIFHFFAFHFFMSASLLTSDNCSFSFCLSYLNMRKYLFLILLAIIPALKSAKAQDIAGTNHQTQHTATQMKIGYFSYNEVLRAMPEYATVQKHLEDLRAQYENEMTNAEKEFNEKYELFLDTQQSMAKAIREKRQSELQSMMERNVAFKEEAKRLLADAEEKAMKPLHDKIAKALYFIGNERAYILIVNTDSNACPYLNPAMAENITTLLNDVLK